MAVVRTTFFRPSSLYTMPGRSGRSYAHQARRAGRGGGVLIFMHSRSGVTIDHRIPTRPGWSTSGFRRPGRHRAKSAVRCLASFIKGESCILLRTKRGEGGGGGAQQAAALLVHSASTRHDYSVASRQTMVAAKHA